MPRERRMVARSAFTSKKLKFCSDSEFLLFVHLVVEADDEGRGEGEPCSLEMTAKNRKWSEARVETMMSKLAHSVLVHWYQCSCGMFYEVINWDDYQQGSWMGVHKKPSKLPHFESGHCEQCGGTLEPVCADTPKISKGKVSKDKINAHGFEDWYGKYPRKKGKENALKYYLGHLSNGATEEQLTVARDALIAEINREGTEIQYVPYASTFLGPSGRWKDYLDLAEAQSERDLLARERAERRERVIQERHEELKPDPEQAKKLKDIAESLARGTATEQEAS